MAAEPAVEPGIRVGGDDGAEGNAHDAARLNTSERQLRNMARRKPENTPGRCRLNHEDASNLPQGGTIGAVKRQTAP